MKWLLHDRKLLQKRQILNWKLCLILSNFKLGSSRGSSSSLINWLVVEEKTNHTRKKMGRKHIRFGLQIELSTQSVDNNVYELVSAILFSVLVRKSIPYFNHINKETDSSFDHDFSKWYHNCFGNRDKDIFRANRWRGKIWLISRKWNWRKIRNRNENCRGDWTKLNWQTCRHSC